MIVTAKNGNESLRVLWHQIRLRLLMTGEGSISKLDSDRISQSSDAGPPPPAGQELIFLERRWKKAKTDPERRVVLWDALALLHHMHFSADRRFQRGTAEWKEAIAHDDRSAPIVAKVFDVSVSTVYNFRRQMRKGAA